MANTVTVNSTLSAVGGSATALTGNVASVAQTLPDIISDVVAVTGSAARVVATLAIVGSGVRVNNRANQSLNASFPMLSSPFVDPNTGLINIEWHRLLLALWNRTGGAVGTKTPNT